MPVRTARAAPEGAFLFGGTGTGIFRGRRVYWDGSFRAVAKSWAERIDLDGNLVIDYEADVSLLMRFPADPSLPNPPGRPVGRWTKMNTWHVRAIFTPNPEPTPEQPYLFQQATFEER